MSPDGYSAFVAWCAVHQVEPVTREQFETWTMTRFQRHMNKLLKRRGIAAEQFESSPTLF
jgi:hypothetical protein